MGTFVLFLLACATVFLALMLFAILFASLVPADVSIVYEREAGEHSARLLVTWWIISIRSGPKDPDAADLCLLGRRVLRLHRDHRGPGGASHLEDLARRTGAILPLIPDIMRILRATIRLRRCDCRLTFGLASPAATGCLYGWLCAIKGALYCFPRLNFTLRPVFDRQVLDVRASLVFRLRYPLITGIRIYRIVRRTPRSSAASGAASVKPSGGEALLV
jgi:hypothetical protein